jgi:MFS superfamily sulfate permease-like transporter
MAALVTTGVTLGVTLMTMFVLAPLIELLPQARLAAVVLVYSSRLIDPPEFGAISRVRRREFVWIIVALAGVVLLGTLKGIIVAIAVSLLALAYDLVNPAVYVLRRKPGTNLFRPVRRSTLGTKPFRVCYCCSWRDGSSSSMPS